MKTREELATVHAKGVHDFYNWNDEYPEFAYEGFLAGWDAKAKQDEERIKSLEEKLDLVKCDLQNILSETWILKKVDQDRLLSKVSEALTKIRGVK